MRYLALSCLMALAAIAKEPILQPNTNIPNCNPHAPIPGFMAELSFFYGQANENSLTPALHSTSDGSDHFTSKALFYNFNWAPGFCLGLGYHSDSDLPWTTELHYMWFHNTAKKSGSVSADNLVHDRFNPTFVPLILGSVASEFHSKWGFHYNVLDWDVGRSFFPIHNFLLQPRFGVRAAIMDQNMRTGYQAFYNTGAIFVPLSSRWTINQDFRGVGLRLGTDLAYYFDSNWGLFGNLFASILPGYFQVKANLDGALFDGMAPSPFFLSSSEKYWAFSPNLESEIGLKYDLFFGKKNHLFSFELSYLMSYWFRQNQFYNATVVFDDQGRNLYTTPVRLNDDLLIQGGKINFAFDF